MVHSQMFFIDVSGQPYNEINVGLSSIQMHKMTYFIKELKNKYPKFIRNKQKGSKIRWNTIRSWLNYFNGQGLRMVCVKLKTKNWNELREFLKEKQYAKEMVYASLYFIALKKYSKKSNSYQVVVCNENYLDIEKVKTYVKKLGNANNLDFQISDTYASQNLMIKVSDIVAAAGKKLKNKELNLDYFEIIYPDLVKLKYYLKKLKKETVGNAPHPI